jgi:catechol-2,3-dioxygenase
MGSSGPNKEQVLSPKAFVHVVLRTTPQSFPSLVHYYKTFLGAHASYENEFLSFLTYDEEHHRIAIIGAPETGPKAPTTCGLEHIAFSFDTLKDLALSYQQRKAHGITPYWCVNHGPATSIYYKDPDGNKIETQVDNLTNDEATAFMMSEEFAINPFGVDFDPEEFVRRVESGEDEASIKTRPKIGARAAPDHL